MKFCKIVEHESYGQILVTRESDENEAIMVAVAIDNDLEKVFIAI